ncbi:alpha/beta fold hydrolase [Paenibacillus soyae]|uniref:Alpha/beta hydrolase n=1 Tax=Paenibacillus soyae TaxID=2969249 RepID=A0A9X2SAT6_9BACL|nr:alpha/beta hydrolase [Paenibacillus soyae]MCR2807049.1 alpha/beta hydrolase [Paenibacillus soyae]
METKVKQLIEQGRVFQYRETGLETAPPVIALHALGQNGEAWNVVAAELGQHFRVFALDQRGHGGSERTGVYSFELMRDDLLVFADALGLERFILIGHSMGGTVSFLFSEAYPDRVERLVIEDSPPPFRSDKLDIPRDPPAGPLPFDWFVIPSILRQLNEPDPEWWERLDRIACPTLIIGGGSNSPIPQHKLKEAAGLIPSGEFVTLEGGGHFVHETKPQEFVAAVRKFLNA